MVKYIRNISGEVTLTKEGDVNLLLLQTEFSEGDYIELNSHIGFYQDFEYATDIIELAKPGFFGLNNDGRPCTTIEISY